MLHFYNPRKLQKTWPLCLPRYYKHCSPAAFKTLLRQSWKALGLALLVAEILHDRLEINGPKVKIAWVVKIWVDIQWCTQEAVNYFCEKLHPRCLTGFWINLSCVAPVCSNKTFSKTLKNKTTLSFTKF